MADPRNSLFRNGAGDASQSQPAMAPTQGVPRLLPNDFAACRRPSFVTSAHEAPPLAPLHVQNKLAEISRSWRLSAVDDALGGGLRRNNENHGEYHLGVSSLFCVDISKSNSLEYVSGNPMSMSLGISTLRSAEKTVLGSQSSHPGLNSLPPVHTFLESVDVTEATYDPLQMHYVQQQQQQQQQTSSNPLFRFHPPGVPMLTYPLHPCQVQYGRSSGLLQTMRLWWQAQPPRPLFSMTARHTGTYAYDSAVPPKSRSSISGFMEALKTYVPSRPAVPAAKNERMNRPGFRKAQDAKDTSAQRGFIDEDQDSSQNASLFDIALALRTRKRTWTREEDQLLLHEVERCGRGNWTKVASEGFSGPKYFRTPCELRARYRKQLLPSRSALSWTVAQDTALLALHEKYGSRWKRIAHFMGMRTERDCKDRLLKLLRDTEAGATRFEGQREGGNGGAPGKS
ncbi:Myb-like protein A [Porphyridium purpureum]|uniref:Myb-like protein A n=1 Tax=Porphyridium purpureum TaxID=35688 RepID=A0A5J4YMH5_PORPP|nr:Myb-like protein A [Porphyridium purpureum]|eukprot:POR7534..scf249_10